nr:PTS system, sucrose-specific IIBC component [Raoultella sp. NCTC 9187]
MQSGIRAIVVMLTSSALGGMVLSLMAIKANSYGLAVLLSPLMYLYDRYQFISYITVGIAVFIFALLPRLFLLIPINPWPKNDNPQLAAT